MLLKKDGLLALTGHKVSESSTCHKKSHNKLKIVNVARIRSLGGNAFLQTILQILKLLVFMFSDE